MRKGVNRRWAVLVLPFLSLLGALLAPGPAGSAEPDLSPVLRVAGRATPGAVRCFASAVTRTETVFWGAANGGDAPITTPLSVTLSRIHPDGTQSLLKREAVERLGGGENVVFGYTYPVVLCLTVYPQLPWPVGGRFRVTVNVGGASRTADAPDP